MVDIIAPVTDYLNKSFFVDNEQRNEQPGNIGLGTGGWVEIVDLDLGTIYVGERILLNYRGRGSKTTAGNVYFQIVQKAGTGGMQIGLTGGFEYGDILYAPNAAPIRLTCTCIAVCTIEGTYTIKVEGICSAGTALMTGPYNSLHAYWLRKL